MTPRRKISLRLLIGLLLLLALLLLYPVRTTYFRTAIPCAAAAVLLCLVAFLWNRRRARWIPLLPPALLALFLILPGRAIDPAALRSAYLANLRSYEGTRYVWGGETWRGVDCSGLLRSALVDAHFSQALHTFNPALTRQGLWFWWHDASARDMSDGYQNQTRQLFSSIPLKNIPPSLLQPGDLAVTADGSHVLAYLGNRAWIEADPYLLKVIQLPPDSPWWNMKVIPCRWQCLTPDANP